MKVLERCTRRAILMAGLMIFLYPFLSPAYGQDDDVVYVRVEENQSIREISEKYLLNPDRWEDILKANHLKSPHEVKAGMVLVLPVGVILRADQALEISGKTIQEATQSGAKIFSPEIIAHAIQLRDAALKFRKSGEWLKAESQAQLAEQEARKALEISKSNQNVAAEAVVEYRQGQVHRRKPSDNVWKDVARYDILNEGERIRTLSESYADILFRDSSRLQLKENAQALIRRMRANLLENTEEATVSLISGDVLALLAGGKKDKQFKLDMPGIEANFKSQRIYTSVDDDGARIAIYDGEAEISSGGSQVRLEENQGTIVPKNQKPLPPQNLLESPELIRPENGIEIIDRKIEFGWNPIANAAHYDIEFSNNDSFSEIVYADHIRGTSTLLPETLSQGSFFWRVYAVSDNKLPGKPSESRFIHIVEDKIPPFLVIQTPENDTLVTVNTIDVVGTTERNAMVVIDNHRIEPDANGRFRYTYPLVSGKNAVEVEAVDPAGNITTAQRIVTYYSRNDIELIYDAAIPTIRPNHFLSGNSDFNLIGQTSPDSVVGVESASASFTAKAKSDASGIFHVNIELPARESEFILTVTLPSGKQRTERFRVTIDDVPPEIRFDTPIPDAVSSQELMISGSIEAGEIFEINERSVPLNDHRFVERLELKHGVNQFQFSALDIVGNIVVIEKHILFDPDPPKLLRMNISKQKVHGGEDIYITVYAEDVSELKKTARYTLKINDFQHSGYLIRSKNDKEYQGAFRTPNNINGTVKILSVTLSDYLDNSKEYRF